MSYSADCSGQPSADRYGKRYGCSTAGAVAWTLGALWSGRQTYPRPHRSVVLGLGVLLLSAVLLLLVIALLPISVAYGTWVLAGLGMGMIVQNSTVVVLDNARGPQATSITAAG